jgi:hypothetical protein
MRTSLLGLVSVLSLTGLFAAACGTSDNSTFGDGSDAGDPGSGGDGGSGPLGPSLGNEGGASTKAIKSLVIDPPTASLTVEVGQAPPTQTFKVTAAYADGTKAVISSGITFSVTAPQVGGIGGNGLYTPSGTQGGHVVVTASAGGSKATATVDVKLHVLHVSPAGSADAAAQAALRAAVTPDAAVNWAYPYDATVFPRGLNAPELQWLGGADTDLVYVHVTSPFYEYESFGTAPSQRFTPGGADWTQLVDSSSGNVDVRVSRLAGGAGGAATVIKNQTWEVAPGTMRGTIYYWAINTGRVMRITPGAAVPDDLFASVDVVPAAKGKCIACHSVSANGSDLVVNAGHWDSTIDETSVAWDLVSQKPAYSGNEVTNGGSAFALAGISADGKVMVQNFAPLRGNYATTMGAFDTSTGAAIPGTGLEAKKLFMPAFSPDNKALLYVDGNPGDLRAYDWDPVTRKATGDHLVVAAGADASLKYIQFPTVTPDHQWVLYQRSNNYGSLGIAGDLYLAPVAGGAEIKLGNLDGDAYPFAAGARDRHLDFEPTFAPVASGGKFWVVFHSRRTYGNELKGPAYVSEGNGVKQLWVAAIDQTPTAGKDPSHPAFHLPGQSLATLNMRGFWALEPCKGNGVGCGSGTECCGGYCAGGGDGGGLVCSAVAVGCSQEGDKCQTAADCCNGGAGAVVCINSVCSFGSVK